MAKKLKDSINVGRQIDSSINMEKATYQGFIPTNYVEWTKKYKKDPNDFKNL